MATEITADGERDAESTRNHQGTDADEYRTTDQLSATAPTGCRGSPRTIGTADAFGAFGTRAGLSTESAAAQSDWEVEVDTGTAEYRHGGGASHLRGRVDRGRQRGDAEHTASLFELPSPHRFSHREAFAFDENDDIDFDDGFIHFEEGSHDYT